MTHKEYKVFICATEQSGDNIGFNIISELLKKNKYISFVGVGGSKMLPFLKEQFFSLKDFKSLGIFEILFSIRKYLKMINFLTKKILKNNYDLIITIDSPDFNYPLAKKLRSMKHNKKIIHLVAPTVWAWRKYRAKKFSIVFDELLVLFEFEIKYFVKHGLKTSLIGHPIYYLNKIEFNPNIKKYNIAFLPGSRMNEVKKLFPYFFLAYKYLLNNHPDINIFIPTLPHLKNLIEKYVKNWKIDTIISIDEEEIEMNFLKTRNAVVCSGTASLELAKRNIPQIIIYKLNFFTELIAKYFINVKYANILNIIENKMLIPEITNSNLNKKTFYNEFVKLMNDSKKNSYQLEKINKVLKKIYSKEPPYTIAAKRIISYL